MRTGIEEEEEEDEEEEEGKLRRSTSGLLFKQRLGKLFRIERLQIIRLLPQPHEFDGQAEFLLNRDDHPPFAGAVQLGDDQSSERDCLVKLARLVEGVHPRGRIQNQQDFVRRAR